MTKEERKIYNYNYYVSNRDRLKKYRIDWYFRTKNKRKKYIKQQRIKNRGYHIEKNKIWYMNNYNKEKIRNAHLKSKYGITIDEYNNLLKKQNYKCDICKNKYNNKNLCVDHNHTTGKIRGLLCNKCNFIIGCSNENIEILKNSIKYIKKWNIDK